ncbi:hypothetical protein [Motilimonas sp. E26]|uniref:hypothetical protein n=1 Tax=Motilimonas sp. E26 TaxID=2865674 RepID=UPI001E4FFC07|nr:hypothetical protein [Motilimonas sp. E26]MCE0555673.1 hypothetical protein [Motilimonas sp. E26]
MKKLSHLSKLPWLEVTALLLTIVFVSYVKASSFSTDERLELMKPAAEKQAWYMLGERKAD